MPRSSDAECERIFVDWQRPCLDETCAIIIDRFASDEDQIGDEIDLSELVCVTPGARAGRLLLCKLIERARREGHRLIPPRVTTPGGLAAILIRAAKPLPTAMEREMAWRIAVERAGQEVFESLGAAAAPETPDAVHAFVRVLSELHETLAGADRTFGEAAGVLDKLGSGREAERWRALAAIESLFIPALEEAGLADPVSALREALARGDIERDRRVVLIGVADLNRMQRAMLSALAGRVGAIVHAPETLADKFDSLGCTIPKRWTDSEIPLKDDCIHIADRPFDQAQAALRIIAAESAGCTADQIVIGLGDETLQRTMKRAGEWAGASMHPAAGHPLSETSPVFLLERIADWVEEHSFRALASLLQHPDLERWLGRKLGNDDEARRSVAKWLGLVEAYCDDHLAGRFTGEWLGKPERAAELKRAYDAVAALTKRLDGDARPLSEWCEAFVDLLRQIFGRHDVMNAERARTVAACTALSDLMTAMSFAARPLQPVISGAEAARYLVAAARDLSIPETAQESSVELLGWLELHLDDAPVLIVTGFNDGSIPASRIGDPFLPDSIRSQLGLVDNAARAGRDAYLLQAILASREQVHVIAGRRGLDESPLEPSRFLFACDPETVLARVDRWCASAEARDDRMPIGLAPARAHSAFAVPAAPDDLAPPESMRVTDFRLYLTCPFRYALKRLLLLEPVDAAIAEMDPLRFGGLAHEALELFGRDETIRDSTDPAAIERFLKDALAHLARTRFGDGFAPAVQVQLAQLEQRFHDFAHWQARWRRDGWEIRHAEIAFDQESLSVALDIPGEDDMPLRGKIDRIDYHPRERRWAVIDYKTGDRGDSPHYTHHGKNKFDPDDVLEWLDLQLPLYQYLVTRAGVIDPGARGIRLGYVTLPRQSGGVRFRHGAWTDRHIDHAVERARQIVRDIRARRFARNEAYSYTYDDFARICQMHVRTSALPASDPGALAEEEALA